MALSHIVSLHTARAKVVNATAREPSRMSSSRRIGPEYFDNYRGLGPYAQAWRIFFDPNYLAELARAAWGLQNGFSILDAGSASGLTVKAMRDIGLEAWGIEKDIRIHRETPENVRSFNLLGDVGRLPFPEDHFDVVYETCLAHLSGAKAEKALSELHRVARKGVIFGSVTSELAVAALGRHDLLGGVKRLGTWWEWSELFFDHDFDLALGEPERLAAAWQVTLQHGRGPGQWFEDEESLRYSLYTKIAD